MEDGKVRVLVVGDTGAGKSSLLNALFHKKILKTNVQIKPRPSNYGMIRITDGEWDGQVHVTGSFDFKETAGKLKAEAHCPLENPDYEFIEISHPTVEKLGWTIPVEWDVMVVTASLYNLSFDDLTEKELEFIGRFCRQKEVKNLFFALTLSDVLEGDSELMGGILNFLELRLGQIFSEENEDFDSGLLMQNIFFVNTKAAMQLRTSSQAPEYEGETMESRWEKDEMEFPQFEEALYARMEQILKKKKEKAAKNAVSDSEP